MAETLSNSRRFSIYYSSPGQPSQDDQRMRARLAAVVLKYDHSHEFSPAIERRIGVSARGRAGTDWREFFRTAAVSDVLDSVTVIFDTIHGRPSDYRDLRESYQREALQFRDEVALIFREQNVAYTLTTDCAVRFLVDEGFAEGHRATIAALQKPRYTNVLKTLEDGLGHLNASPPNAKEAIRGVFNACEGIFRLRFQGAPRLAGDQVKKYLRPAIEARYPVDRAARSAALRMVDGFTEWAEGAHWYRHEQGVEDPIQPDLDLAVVIIAHGLAYLRWLAVTDDRAKT